METPGDAMSCTGVFGKVCVAARRARRVRCEANRRNAEGACGGVARTVRPLNSGRVDTPGRGAKGVFTLEFTPGVRKSARGRGKTKGIG